jgi:GNAT superfamily N-acetyltransferase
MIVEYKIRKGLEKYDDPGEYTDHVEGEVFLDPDESVNKTCIARVSAYVVRVTRATNDEADIFDVFDAVSQELRDIGDACMDFDVAGGDDCIKGGLTEARCSDTLFIASMEILPRFRKHGVGHFILQSVIETFGGTCGIVVIEPHPLIFRDSEKDDFTRAMKVEKLPRDKRKGAAALRKHWAKLGFQPVPKTKNRFWYIDLDGEQPEIPKGIAAAFEKVEQQATEEEWQGASRRRS